MFEILTFAIALSMDAFAITIAIGTKQKHIKRYFILLTGLLIGTFHGVMLLVGYLGGVNILNWLSGFSSWFAFIVLAYIGGKMMYESFNNEDEPNIEKFNFKILIVLSFATSIDALAVGFTLPIITLQPLLACLLTAIVASICSVAGLLIGMKGSMIVGAKAEFMGGFILVLVALKLVLF